MSNIVNKIKEIKDNVDEDTNTINTDEDAHIFNSNEDTYGRNMLKSSPITREAISLNSNKEVSNCLLVLGNLTLNLNTISPIVSIYVKNSDSQPKIYLFEYIIDILM